MKVSYNWLKNHVDLQGLTSEQVATKLTFAGCEVEGIERLASGSNLVIGEIISCVSHPDSDHLHVLNVDEGKFGVHQIVCGAPNARKGLKVIVARTGAKLPQIEIKPSLIRGVESDGMCCSLLELGVDAKYLSDYQKAGIEELPNDAPVGEEDVLGYLGLDDEVLELSVLPNRPDLYALNNVAKEVGCLFEREVKLDEVGHHDRKATSFQVGSLTPDCPLFTATVVKGVKPLPSPKWLTELLTASGIRSINSIVDIGNYVMLLTGQPINMYDLDKLPENSLIVRDDVEEDFVAMDENTYPLKRGDLLVTSSGRGMCLAGVMTAKECEVDDKTTNVVIESAYFNGANIRHTSNRIGLGSDSSLRFCKGVNPHQSTYVQDLCVDMLFKLSDAELAEETVVYDEMDHRPKFVDVDLTYINGRLGTSFTAEEVIKTLDLDGFKVEARGESFRVLIPAWRIDIDGKADISEEVIRLLGYESVPSVLPASLSPTLGLSKKQKDERRIREYLLDNGVSEAITYTLLSKKEAAKFNYLDQGEPFVLQNPMSVDREVVRKNALHSLLLSAAYNAARQVKSGALFEVTDVDSKAKQGKRLSIVLFGENHRLSNLKARDYGFFDLKGLVEGILRILNINNNRYAFLPWSLGGEEMHPYQTAELRLGKQLVGYLGILHPLAAKEYGLRSAAVAEIDLSALLEVKVGAKKAIIPPKYPSVTRDLALLVPLNVAYEDLRRAVLKADKLIVSSEIFDIYEGTNVEDGYRSIAISLTIRSDEKTLGEADVNAAVKKSLDLLSTSLGAKLRQ